ncbi:hypothetical protein VIF_003487 [Vibrio cholerae TM 11079-80]|nr:hypothetical protein VIF_003487 [Vibrio cholerae TM 11079-80]
MSEGKHLVFSLDSHLFGFFKAFTPESGASFIPEQHFDFIALFVGKQEQSTAAKRQVCVAFDNRGKAVDGLSKIDTFTI